MRVQLPVPGAALLAVTLLLATVLASTTSVEDNELKYSWQRPQDRSLFPMAPTRTPRTRHLMEKTVWLLWLSGWHTAPWLCQQVALSWRAYNPTWRVVLLDNTTLSTYLPDLVLPSRAGPQAKSDVIRLALMARHGGVWADATMLCLEPLDDWLPNALEPAGLFMYRAGDGCRHLTSWFMIFEPNHYIAKGWFNAAMEFWSKVARGDIKQADVQYLWMDILWRRNVDKDPQWRAYWDDVPFLCCDDSDQSHGFRGFIDHFDPAARVWRLNPPHAIKLSHHGKRGIPGPNSTDYIAIQTSLRRLWLYGLPNPHPDVWPSWADYPPPAPTPPAPAAITPPA
ncbi:capsular polysaccharide synthesis protein-domain-containing protein [Haematococcus lacustris]